MVPMSGFFISLKGEEMEPYRDLNEKRVFDLSRDRKTLEVVCRDCKTTVTVAEDGTLKVRSEKLKKPA